MPRGGLERIYIGGNCVSFFLAFNELWDAAIEGRRVMTPEDAMTMLGLTPQELDAQWWASKSCARLEYGFYVAYFEQEQMYVINGFYPRLLESFTAPDSQTCVFVLSWPESRYTWNSFRLEVVGAVDPSAAEPTSLRRLLYDHWREYGLSKEPSLTDNGLDTASGPLEAMAHRFVWMHRRATEDDFGRALLREGVSQEFLEQLVKNPTVTYCGKSRPVFELFENMQSSEVLHHVSVLFDAETLKRANRVGAGLGATATVSGTADWTIVLDDEDAEEKRNRALLFVKPHANTPETRALVEERVMRVQGVQLVAQRHVSGTEIASQQMMYKHYRTIARYAVKVPPMSINVGTQNRAMFQEAFGIAWKDALRSGRVWNAETAIHTLGEVSAEELNMMWGSATKTLKLAPGAYVAYFAPENVYVINGFYPYLRDTYGAEDANVTCYIVTWPEARMTWRAFREELVGSTNPSNAPPDSLRGLIRDRWQELGLRYPPTTTDNGVHASAGPLEAVLERHLWMRTPLSHDPLTLRLQGCGLTGALLYRWGSNQEVTLGGKWLSSCVFDLLENKQTSEMVDIMREAEQQVMAVYTETPTNRAVVMLKPFAVSECAIERVRQALNKAGVVVQQELSIFSTRAVECYLNGAAFRTVAQLADVTASTLQDEISADLKDRFREVFHVTWDHSVADGKLMGAIAACEEFNLSPTELLRLWDASSSKKLGRGLYVAFLKSHDVFVINGFVPFVRESYGKPGSRVYVFEVEWKESTWTWKEFCKMLIGDPVSPQAAAHGSLQRTFAEEWKFLGLQLEPVSRATSALYASEGPLEAAADREMWLEAELPEDPFVQQLLLDGVPLSLLLPYVRNEHRDNPALQTPQHVEDEEQQQTHQTHWMQPGQAGSEMLCYTRQTLSRHQQSSEVIRRIKALTSQFLRAIKMNYAFVWVKPHAGTPEVVEWVPSALQEHRLEVIASGHLMMEEVIGKHLVDQQYEALYRNAMGRSIKDLPITMKQMVEFERTFGITWSTAVNLHMIINAAEAEGRMGLVDLLKAWDEAPRKACLSSSLYVAYLEAEGLYVVNGFYPYLRARMYTGPRIYWYVVMWDVDIMTWDDFHNYVIGGDVPATAETASLRNSLWASWVELGLQQPPDGVDNGFHASASPIAGVADRVAWLGTNVEEDVFGRLLIQGGVNPEYLRAILQNPLVRHRDEPVDAVSDVLDKLCTENPLLVAQLVGLQSSGGMHLVSKSTDSIAAIPKPPSSAVGWPGHKNDVKERCNEQAVAKECQLNELAGVTSSCSAAAAVADATVILRRNYAFLLVNPKCLSTESEGLAAAYITDFLQRHKVQVEAGGSIRTIAPAVQHVGDKFQADILWYAVKRIPSQYALDGDAMYAFQTTFGERWNASKVRNAVDVAVEFNLSALRLKELWDACEPRTRIAPSLYIGKMPNSGLYLVNGFALHSIEVFNLATSVKRYFLLSWDNADADYAAYIGQIIGDPYVEAAEPGSLQRRLCEEWKSAGFQCPPDPFEGAVMTSTSALEAIHQRQLWLSLGLQCDPVGRVAVKQLGVSPYVLRRTVTNPPLPWGDGRRLFETVRGQGSAAALELLKAEDTRCRAELPRNSAFLLVKSHALCRPFAMTIEMALSNAKVRVDEEGDISGAVVRGRGLVHHLYATASKYAVGDVSAIHLTQEERDRARREFGVAWDKLVDGGVVVNAYRALEVLGGVTPQHLYECWKNSTRKLVIRSDLVVAELVGSGIFVVNGFFPELKNSLESATSLLHWYIVSWFEEDMHWPVFLERVIGDDCPKAAAPQSIRGQLFQRWREFGLSMAPDTVHNGLHVSQGALQAMRERVRWVNCALAEDYLGDILLRQGVPERVLQVWLDNPEVTSGGREAGVFEHLLHCDTSRLLVLLTALTEELCRAETEGTTADTAHIPLVDDNGEAGAPPPDCVQEFNVSGAESKGSTLGRLLDETDEKDVTLLFRNTAVILLKPHTSNKHCLMEFVERLLAEKHIRIRQEFHRQSCARLVDRHLSSSMYYAMHQYHTSLPEVTEAGRARFHEVFGEDWDYALTSQRVMGAFAALSAFSMTPSQLYVKWSVPEPEHVQLAYDMEVVKFHAEDVYVVNALVPLERERMLQMGREAPNIHGYVVSWDQRECSWHTFLHEVIGDPDPANAAEASLRGQLYNDWEKLGLPSRPNRIDNIVLASGGPLQAFMERELWCSTSDLLPDLLVRALCYLEHDPSQLLEWKDNPLVQYTSRTLDAPSVTKRMFDFTHEMDTREFVDFMAEQDGFFIPIAFPTEEEVVLKRPAERRPRIPVKKDAYRLDVLPLYYPNSTKPDAWLQEALLNAEEDDMVRLWEYYGGSADWEEGEAASVGDELVRTATGSHGRLRGTINGEAFRRDIEALDFFGLPLAKCQVKKLFDGMTWRGDGRATYEEFRIAMAVLHQM
ncbi:nucleoside-diphosphate kinase [Trypanosoma rangeli]|uniref:Nucleoside-diphosphate kinase n=1 Tax=Trypanosoma rangeli TaxID=5698 RepID=A0A422MXL9_TRYRA|nr:nucleoside-diphosphate kinase [Trypanosoma rangeli]RNE97919.1 nucleoside-diphosphate kinase [Trypanosoma rangeli]|eukprot:RNE97919.1 nucleoside-diphosphate kinase [Trypanosoma rangeli]